MREEMIVVGKKGDIALARARESSNCSTCRKCHGGPSGNFLELHVPDSISIGHRILVDVGRPGLSKDLRALSMAAVSGFLMVSILLALAIPGTQEVFFLAFGVGGAILASFAWRFAGRRLEGRPQYVKLLREDSHWETSAAISNTSSNVSGSLKSRGSAPTTKNS